MAEKRPSIPKIETRPSTGTGQKNSQNVPPASYSPPKNPPSQGNKK